MEYRLEHDTMGEVRVPADRYWGALPLWLREKGSKVPGKKAALAGM